MKNIGNNLYYLRKSKNLSQEELAEKLAVSRQAVSKWERDEAYPDTENMIALAELYGITIDDLIYRDFEKDGMRESDESATGAAECKKEDNDDDDDEDENDPKVIESKRPFRLWYDLPYPIIITVIYLAWGFLAEGWAIGWTLYITIPVYYSVIDVIRRKKIAAFCYPAFAAFLYTLVGMAADIWHPTWLIFVTIPIYYIIAEQIDKVIKKKLEQKEEQKAA